MSQSIVFRQVNCLGIVATPGMLVGNEDNIGHQRIMIARLLWQIMWTSKSNILGDMYY